MQITSKPDDHLAESKFESMYQGVHKLDVPADRGFVSEPSDMGVAHVLVVGGGVGVDVSVSAGSVWTRSRRWRRWSRSA